MLRCMSWICFVSPGLGEDECPAVPGPGTVPPPMCPPRIICPPPIGCAPEPPGIAIPELGPGLSPGWRTQSLRPIGCPPEGLCVPLAPVFGCWANPIGAKLNAPMVTARTMIHFCVLVMGQPRLAAFAEIISTPRLQSRRDGAFEAASQLSKKRRALVARHRGFNGWSKPIRSGDSIACTSFERRKPWCDGGGGTQIWPVLEPQKSQ